MTSWTAEWDEYGGYDCMTAAWNIKDGDELIAEIDCATEDHKDNPTAAANARLIAAAPSLVEVLEFILTENNNPHLVGREWGWKVLDQARGQP